MKNSAEKKINVILIVSVLLTTLLMSSVQFAEAQSAFLSDLEATATTSTATSTASVEEKEASTTAANIINQRREAVANTNDTTQPEELTEKVAIISLFEARPVDELNFYNFMAYWLQQGVQAGIPANTIFLILLTPILALMVSFVRVIIGLPTLDMLVPIALSFAFVSLGVSVGLFILGTIILASYVSKKVLSDVKIMFYPKRSLSMLFLSLFVFAALTIALMFEFERILSLSIFPVIVLILLGDLIVSVQLHKSASETFYITGSTIGLGLLGFALASSDIVRDTLVLYPELILLTIPANLIIGRYFGLRLIELFRFNQNKD